MQASFCYILANQHGVTYNGYTNNLPRRIRQHNGEITGGARSTRNKGPWKYIAVITSNDPEFTKNKALSLEWHIRYPTNKKPRPPQFKGPQGRIDALPLVFAHPYFDSLPFTVYLQDGLKLELEDTERITVKPLHELQNDISQQIKE
jgi:predicted GIY-YIG superfamily endonuclease